MISCIYMIIYSPMLQRLFFTIQFHHNFLNTMVIHSHQRLLTPLPMVVYTLYISLLPASIRSPPPPPPSPYSTCTIVPSLSSSPRYHTNITRSPRDCDPVISTSFTLGLPCQWERERGLEESEKERENKKERGREREGKGKETLQCQRVERKSNK